MRLVPKQKHKTTKNVILGAAGLVIFPVAWLFMDFTDSERVEVHAFQLRNKWLRNLARQKKCGPMPGPIRFAKK